MNVVENKYLPPNSVVLKRDGEVVWAGNLSDPWDDVECDTVVVSPADFARIKTAIPERPGYTQYTGFRP